MDNENIVNYVMDTPGNTNPAVLRGMLGQLNNGDTLPVVTSDDNGDVLTVVNGAWDKAAPSGGGGDIVVVNFEWDSNISKYRADKTDSEIEALILNGKTVIGRTSDGVYINYGRYFYSISFGSGQAFCEQLHPSTTDYIYEVTTAMWSVTES